ncbi:MAG: SpoIIE family protein phosphatase [Oscillospiraceae bacterium]|nr:SpoIIE family protein phosphatase [Oscillospiraceae bacterium]
MKKFKNLVIGGIQQKVFNLVLVTILLLIAAYTAVIVYQSSSLKKLTAETNLRQKEAIAEISETTMDAVVADSLTSKAEMAAMLADDLFVRLSSTVQILADNAENLLQTPELYSARPFALPDASMEGKISLQLVGETNRMPEDPAVLEKLSLLANLSDVMTALYRNAGTSSVYIAVPEGYMLCVDDKADARIDEQGNVLTIPIRERPWYLGAAQSDSIFFTDVLKDTFTGEIGITCTIPIRQDGRLIAVAAADLFLDQMEEAVSNSGDVVHYTCIINNQGHVVFSPQNQGTLRARTAEEAVDLRSSEQADLAAFVRDALNGVTGVRELDLDGDRVYLAGAPVKTLGWAVVSVVDKAATERPTIMMQEQFDSTLNEAATIYNKNLDRSKQTIIVLILLILIMGLTAGDRLSRRIIRPLEHMTNRVRSLGGKNLQFQMEEEYRTGDEIEVLAESFSALSAKTLQYVDQVKRVTAEKERIGAELTMANAIQRSQLPRLFPPFPNRHEFNLFATMKPAKEVGGDFYDFFMVDNDHVALVMADVSGKGVPAALFMMVTRMLIKSRLQSGESVAEALTNVNRQLCENNELGYFVTVWLAVLEISTGKGVAVNAGHEHPVLRRCDGKYELILYRHSLAVAAMDGVRFKQHEFRLCPGDSFFVYTDGVTEATNGEHELFGTDRMLEALNKEPDAEPDQLLKNVMDDIHRFMDGEDQFDDITMMCLKYNGPVE